MQVQTEEKYTTGEMMQAVDNHCHSSPMLQAPTSWAESSTPSTMDFSYDSLYHSYTPSGYNAFPSVLSQTLCELDIDNSIHKLFEGLPEIVEPDIVGRDGSVCKGPAVSVSTVFQNAFPAHGSRPSSSPCAFGSQTEVIPVQDIRTPVTHATGDSAKALMSPMPKPQEMTPPVTVAADRKGRPRTFKSKAAPRQDRIVENETRTNQPSLKKDLETIPTRIQAVPHIQVQALQHPSTSHCLLPATAAVGDPSIVDVSQHGPFHSGVGLGPQMCPRPPKRSRKDTAHTANIRTQKTRYFDKVEHIVRERWRRDDMAGKFLALESLLPPSTKRDRSTIVEDSIKLVKSLQHRKDEILKRRHELRSAVASGGLPNTPGVKLNKIIQKIGSLAVIPVYNLQALESGSPSSSSMALSSGLNTAGVIRPLEVQPSGQNAVLQIPIPLSDCVKRFFVQSELASDNVVLEMICEQIPNFQSLLLKSMESLGLEVVRCSIIRTLKRFVCNITVKPFHCSAAGKLSSTDIMEGLYSAFGTP
ncbi:uncharacterized protein [Physcomitrium patens]|uniref:BHLH domain-containing protein n=1 Tax=Physcomitrium patens TaxID=3218 RepID=A0A2K1JGZ3_PHYPA|nr:uncharacterized protein LOC112291683 [Physcomitrium patens]XP_024395236.1 uncharacterized protein LOC112291683 [Physcomitrium patens]XP_024395237.1 uncharacterized protein LOC112291683 [Physcomitrium patens]PNR40833.1 hypothetical protein PHYPA_018236 [Physcomitrium patens]|eukprot:XP_024395235.1 uncharacterized protein LOC112291683 [Physcomitrella patens]